MRCKVTYLDGENHQFQVECEYQVVSFRGKGDAGVAMVLESAEGKVVFVVPVSRLILLEELLTDKTALKDNAMREITIRDHAENFSSSSIQDLIEKLEETLVRIEEHVDVAYYHGDGDVKQVRGCGITTAQATLRAIKNKLV